MNEISHEFRQAAAGYGLDLPAEIIADGALHRFTVPGDRAKSNNGWYVLHPDTPAAGAFGCWKRQLSQTWCHQASNELSEAEQVAYKARLETMRRQREAGKDRVQAECRGWCAEAWAKARDATGNNPYLQRKGVQAYGLKACKDALLVPVRDLAGVLHGLQFIQADGAKKFKTGTNKSGHFCKIGHSQDNAIVLCEGYATGASIHQASGHAVLIAFDCGNLLPVAKAIRSKFPAMGIIVAADDDQATDANPGLSMATEAARAVGGRLAVPDFGDQRPDGATDFNDLHVWRGLAAVKVCIEAAKGPADDDDPAAAGLARLEAEAAEQVQLEELLARCATDKAAAFAPDLITFLFTMSSKMGQAEVAAYQVALERLKGYGVKKGDLATALKAEKLRQEGLVHQAQREELNRQITAKTAKMARLKKDDSPYQIIERENGFRNGTYFFGIDDNGVPKEPEMFCGPLTVSARTRNSESSSWGALLRWPDLDGKPHCWAMPAEMLAGSGEEYRKALLDGGLEILPGPSARYHLGVYIQTARTEKMAICTEATGWHDGVFVLPNTVIGDSGGEEILFQSATAGASHYHAAGTLAEWRDNVAVLCRGNSRLMFSVCVALASTMLELIGAENGGFHLVGDSSTGKSTALIMAASVFGGAKFVSSWRSTINGLEGIAAAHNGALLILDELAQCNPKDAGETAYMLANGDGKQRAIKSGFAKKRNSWKLLFLSSGEVDLAQHMREAGKKARAGQEVRLVSVPVAGAHGIFDHLHGEETGKAMSEKVKGQAAKYHGTAGLAFIGWLAANRVGLAEVVKTMQAGFIKQFVEHDADGQVQRVAGRFALCAVAGEMATAQGLTGWATGEAMAAARDCLQAWIDHRGGTGKGEVAAILSQTRAFFELHGSSRFEGKDGRGEQRIINRAGFYEDHADGSRTFLVLGEVFKNELCQGFSEKTVKAVLIKAGMLKAGKHGPAQNVRLPGLGSPKVYVFSL